MYIYRHSFLISSKIFHWENASKKMTIRESKTMITIITIIAVVTSHKKNDFLAIKYYKTPLIGLYRFSP